MTATNFKTVNQTYRQLIGNGLTYSIPRFQRDYSWTVDEWDDLWQDLLIAIEDKANNKDSSHYMGYLVLQSSDDKNFDVIDGQQRLTTLSIVVLAGLKNLQKLINDHPEFAQQNQQRLEQLRQTYVGYLDPITLQPKSKLNLNNNNDFFYQNYLVTLSENIPRRNMRSSEHSLRKAFEWFDDKIAKYIKNSENKGVEIATFIGNMSDLLFFTVITVNDELNAYKVFETLNARGIKLSSTDLLKNYLFSIIHKETNHLDNNHELNGLERHWNKIVERLGSESFPDFLRVFWNSKYSFVRQNELFKKIRDKITNRREVFSLIREIDENIDLYLSLNNPSTATNWSLNARKYAETLKMFNVKQPYALLMSAYRNFKAEGFEKTLKTCVIISFRYNVIGGLHTGELERVYYKASEKINENIRYSDMILLLKEVYVKDEHFKSYFSDKILKTTSSRNKKVVRYILTEIERKESGVNNPALDDTDVNIEHIYPENPDEGWEIFDFKDGESMTYRLGNMALCEKNINSQMANLEFEQKKPVLTQSHFQTTRAIADYPDWNPDAITKRQRLMAKVATSIWRIDQLS
ncbi:MULTISPECIES: DUF262 domain-containing protein [Moraxella]|uniref:DUF262 domain-containing protein n=2 Tax=Moraxella lacunata TaxID=477 RepID=A0A1B8PV45_MORLA|nr:MULTISPECIES: DUF262 domain-containing protein [Moraxella]MBE9579152.1 DUF262 domain-containing protein [Moraxella sp. K1664]MBE9588434.1 DUF262 domain-containing protein [Moraxella sp. K1630]MBE9590858.1 DUF262 domain-containing protein [Moraxella sp. K127]MBE9596594.1 DUF262 domain-containing protein [Moraxella sp. K2450]MDH9219146.1 DUF262 domain-containing HNH endonuclease family protein [Moraxella lacunata]